MGSENIAYLYSLPQEAPSVPTSHSSEDDEEDSSAFESSEEEEEESGVLLPGPVKKRKKKQSAKTQDGVTEASTTRVFVGRLPKHFTEQQIRDLFVPFGSITNVTNSWGYVPDNGKYKGVALVNFTDASAAHAACAAPLSVDNTTLIVRPHTKVVKKPKQAVGSRTLFVGNLPFGITKQALAQLFAPCGTVLSVRLPMNEETKKPLGFGFVVFQGLVHMKLAMKLNGHLLAGRAITVGEQKKIPKEERTSKSESTATGAKGSDGAKGSGGAKFSGTASGKPGKEMIQPDKGVKKRKGLAGGGSDQTQSVPSRASKTKPVAAPAPVAAVASAFCGKRVKLS